MAIATKVEQYIEERGLNYDVLTHPHSHNSMETARLARVPASSLAKSVVLLDDQGYLMAVLPSTQHVHLGWLSKAMDRPLRLATESELAELFADCEPGAIPPLGSLYGLPVVMDDSLMEQDEIYFEAGDHEKVIEMGRDDFLRMMSEARHVHFGEHYWRH
jgi:Ala-tRNA(Pro) deacylase